MDGDSSFCKSECFGNRNVCREVTSTYYCTRKRGHSGDHVACSPRNHNLFKWKNEEEDVYKQSEKGGGLKYKVGDIVYAKLSFLEPRGSKILCKIHRLDASNNCTVISKEANGTYPVGDITTGVLLENLSTLNKGGIMNKIIAELFADSPTKDTLLVEKHFPNSFDNPLFGIILKQNNLKSDVLEEARKLEKEEKDNK